MKYLKILIILKRDCYLIFIDSPITDYMSDSFSNLKTILFRNLEVLLFFLTKIDEFVYFLSCSFLMNPQITKSQTENYQF